MLGDWPARLLGLAARRLDGRHRALTAFAASRVPWLTGPYPIQRYAALLEAIRDAGFRTPPFGSTDDPGAVPDVYVRHDIDLPRCPLNVAAMAGEAMRRGIVPGIYFQANDRAPYDLRACRSLAQELAAAGAEIGLHTICYTASSPWAALSEEKHRFADALGFAPRSVNAHGLGRYMFAERLAFYRQVTPATLHAHGFAFSDLHPGLRRYDYVAEDSNAAPGAIVPDAANPFPIPAAEQRFMKDDMMSLPPLRGVRYLVLTHPGYWLP